MSPEDRERYADRVRRIESELRHARTMLNWQEQILRLEQEREPSAARTLRLTGCRTVPGVHRGLRLSHFPYQKGSEDNGGNYPRCPCGKHTAHWAKHFSCHLAALLAYYL